MLSSEEKVAWIERVCTLSEDGELSERYGGPGRAGTDASEVTSAG